MLDVALMTSADLASGTEDDTLLAAALRAHGIVAEPRVWSAGVPEARLAIVRTTWDYDQRAPEFLAWADSTADAMPLWNPAPLVRWNHHKSYLRDLDNRGLRVVPTGFLPAGEEAEISGVVKPAVGASARGARRVKDEVVVADEDLIVQPFLSSIEPHGEVSLMLFDGEYSHAVRKRAAAGDWRVQEEFGGTIEAHEPDTAELALAARSLHGIDHLYARVDLVRDASGAPALIELELIEPDLFLRNAPGSAERFAAAIARRIGS
ncbi:MAG: ATP-grasp domain-containing protein [Planctomycetota bacterium]|jgi:glutathione synthase/RimK-type ligase-like ATP-grasp enzyme